MVSFCSDPWNETLGTCEIKNLIYWERMPVAITPTESYESHGAYSGGAFVKDDVLHLFYTGNVKMVMDQVIRINAWLL